MAETLEYCRALLAPTNATIIVPGDRHWPLFERLCIDAKASGNLVADAWNAALAIESGCEWITTD
jgi:predicted nucleic acid-binding protein